MLDAYETSGTSPTGRSAHSSRATSSSISMDQRQSSPPVPGIEVEPGQKRPERGNVRRLPGLPAQQRARRAFSGLVGLPSEPNITTATAGLAPAPKVPEFRSTEDLLADINAQRKAKRADAARARRKTKAEQLIRIKETLKTPAADVLAEVKKSEWLAKRKAKKEANDLSMNRGKFLTGAPAGKGLLESGGYSTDKVSVIDGRHQMEELELGAREDTSNGFDRDSIGSRRIVKPQGFGPVSDEAGASPALVKNAREFADHKARRFQVNLANGYEASLLARCLDAAIVEFCLQEHREGLTVYTCRLCKSAIGYHRDALRHFEHVHGAELETEHDAVHGDVVGRLVRKAQRSERKLAQLGKRARSQYAQQQRQARLEQSRREGLTIVKGATCNERDEQERTVAERQSWDIERETNKLLKKVP